MRFSIDIEGALNVVSEYENQIQLVKQYKETTNSIKNILCFSENVRLMPIRALRQIINELDNAANSYVQMSKVLKNSVVRYKKCEEGIINNISDVSVSWRENINTNPPEEDYTIFSWRDLFKIISKAGLVGATIDGMYNILVEGFSPKGLIASGKIINAIFGFGANVAASSKGNWVQYIFGMNNALDKIETNSFKSGFLSSMDKQIDDLTLGSANSIAKKAKVVSKWAGHVLSFASNAVENYTEFEGEGVDGVIRGTTETFIETGVDIGLGMLATAGVTAAAAAIGVASAPALVIGGIATAVVIGANATCKWITGGKDIGEVVADFVCDQYEKRAERTKKIIDNVAETAGNIGQAISKGVSSAWRGLCEAFS